MREKDIRLIADDIGLEQILIDAEMSHERLLMILHESGYIDLEVYLENFYE